MNVKNILISLSSHNEKLKKMIINLPTNSTKTEKKTLETLTKVAFFAYTNDDIDTSMEICDELSKIKFNNDYEYWTWIEYSLALRAELAIKKQLVSKKQESIKKIKEALNSGEGLHKKIRLNVHDRFMSGEGVTLDEIEKNITPPIELSYRLIHLMKLIKIKVLGGSSLFTAEKLTLEVKNNLDRMRELLTDDEDILKSSLKI
ncbi:DUF6707 family protein [Serratia rhizosphaerae]|uniref:AbiV family abortive infection protein n=1 Tax=Serratia rhizosphaerae TaxID=2597702 RepID=A0ABX6GRQ0_9GAMM|nr:DUF6707 family protein [Serratia rhizosphaerae]QHA88933.1 hypothetical protein FO014_19215 [Serratia rhizosphaerae]